MTAAAQIINDPKTREVWDQLSDTDRIAFNSHIF